MLAKNRVGMSKQPSIKMLADPGHLIALGFGSGLVPLGPGTAGTLVGVAVFLWFLYSPIFSIPSYFLLCTILFCVGIVLCARTSDFLDSHDHKAIVFDEIVGFFIGAGWIPLLELFRLVENAEIQFLFVPLTFVLFRFFDIVKPWPISKVDRECKGGMGIMLDDLLAGVLTFVLAPVICIFLGYL